MAKGKETPTGEKKQQGRGGGRQGLHCGEANPIQRRGEKNKTPPETGGDLRSETQHLFKRETEHLWLRQLIHDERMSLQWKKKSIV